jgi:DnaJ-domain-containing protein 1
MPSRDTIQYWIGRFLLGLLLVVAAAKGTIVPLPGAVRYLGSFLQIAGGFYLAYSSITPMVRLATRNARTRKAWTESATNAFSRASLPRRIYYLLAAVAESDGPMTIAERETVRHFLLERFLDPIQADELRTWEAQPLQINDRMGLAARIATGIDDTELDSLLCWCCLVAFADGKYAEHEHIALQEVAKGLGLAATRARMLFHLARAQYMRGQKQGEPVRPGQSLNARAQALNALGLPADATPEQIRRRHRELVRRFHPDAQPNLGPVALREATERFTEIQRAYETLSN